MRANNSGTERMGADATDAILDEIRARETGADKVLSKRIIEFRRTHASLFGVSRKMNITYDQIPDILELLDITAIDLFTMLGASSSVFSGDSGRVLAMLETCSADEHWDAIFPRLLALGKNMCAPFWTYRIHEGKTPSTRLRCCAVRKSSGISKKTAREKLFETVPSSVHVVKDGHGYARLPAKDIPAMAESLDVPLKWVLDLPDKTACYTRNIDVDNLFCLYLLLDSGSRQCFVGAVQAVFHIAGAANDPRFVFPSII